MTNNTTLTKMAIWIGLVIENKFIDHLTFIEPIVIAYRASSAGYFEEYFQM